VPVSANVQLFVLFPPLEQSSLPELAPAESRRRSYLPHSAEPGP
jgi:hypothetical protein